MTVASNLPDGDAATDRSSQSEDSETRETVNYEISEIQREVTRAPGAIRRISVAVLVDGIRTVAPDGTEEWVPRPEEELAALRQLVASAVGLDEARGDSLTLQSLEFEPGEAEGSDPSAAFVPDTALDLMRLIQVAILAIAAVLLGLFVVRPILARPNAAERLPVPAQNDDDGPLPDLGFDFAPMAAPAS